MGRLDHELVLSTVFGRGQRLSENICFPLAVQIATSVTKQVSVPLNEAH